MALWPVAYEKTERGIERCYDLPSRLLKDRVVLLFEEINSSVAASIIAQLLFLEAENPTKPITMYINSPGGEVSSGLAIYDVMNKISCPIATVCVGMAASMAAFLLSSGSMGQRYCLANSTVMIHQPLGGGQGQATDIAIIANRILQVRQNLYNILALNTERPMQMIAAECERDNYMSAEEAKNFGLVDQVVQSVPKAYIPKL